MLYLLQTLKSEPLAKQADLVARLADENSDLLDAIFGFYPERSEHSVYHIQLRPDPAQVVRVALLALVYADIGTVHDRVLRERFLDDLTRLCQRLGVDYADLALMSHHHGELTELVKDRSTEPR